MTQVSLSPISLFLISFLLLPKGNDGVRARNFRSRVSSSRMQDECTKFCEKWGADNFKDEYKTGSYGITCLDTPPPSTPSNKCTPSTNQKCPVECDGECDDKGLLTCPKLPKYLWPTIPKSCLKYCQDTNFMPPDLTFDTLEYQIDCDFDQNVDSCGLSCPDCPSPGQGNTKCVAGANNLKCPKLDPSVLPETCRRFCAEQAGIKGLTLADGTFSVDCGSSPHSTNIKRPCGQTCPSDCNGFCANLKLHCPAVDPVKPEPTTGTPPSEEKGPEAEKENGGSGAEKQPGGKAEDDEEDGEMLMIYLLVGGFLTVFVVCGVIFWWWRKGVRGSGGVGSNAAPAPAQEATAASSETTLQPEQLPQEGESPAGQGQARGSGTYQPNFPANTTY